MKSIVALIWFLPVLILAQGPIGPVSGGGHSGVPATRQVATTAPLTGGGALSNDLTLSIPAATGSVNGYLSATDWVLFNAKLGTSAIGATVQAYNANTTTAGNTFNGVSQLVQTNGSGQLPAIDGHLLTGFVASQIPNLDAAKITTGTVGIARIGSGGDGSGTHALFDDGIFHLATGTGSVTDIGVTTANGVSGVSDHNGALPRLTITLGAITPSSVAATGTVGGSNLSGTNTGDQTITLTGNVTGSGTGSFAATIANSAVTYAKIQNVAGASLLGNPSGSSAAPVEIPIGGGFQFSGGTLLSYSTPGSLSGGSPTADTATTKTFKITLSTATTVTFTNFGDGDSIVVRAQQAASGGPYTVAFASSGDTFAWQGGSQPTQTATASKSDFYQFHKQGTVIYALTSQNY